MTGVRRASGWVTLFLTVVVLLAGCGSDSNDESANEGVADSRGAGEEAGENVEVADEAALPEGQPLSVERRIVYTADMVVRVDDVEEAAADAVEIAESAGGFLFSQDLDLEGEQEGRLTLKVPPESDQIDSVMASLADLGEALDSQLSADDVTAEAVDLEGRLASARASADRLRGMLGEAANTTDLVTIEAELARREGEIESLEGQLRVLNEQTDMATIEVRFTEDDDVDFGEDLPSFVDGIQTGIGVVVAIAVVGIAIAGFLLPFVVLAAILWWGSRRFRRNRRRKAPTVPPDE